jgi:hypothetical protein
MIGVEYSSSGEEKSFHGKITAAMRCHPVLLCGKYTVYFAGNHKKPFPSEVLFPSELHQFVGYGTRMIVTSHPFDVDTFRKESTTLREEVDDDVDEEEVQESSSPDTGPSDEEDLDSDASLSEEDSDSDDDEEWLG